MKAVINALVIAVRARLRSTSDAWARSALGQVGVYISYCVDSHHWIMLDADRSLPECWFEADHTDLWKRWHIPKRSFKTKAAIGIRLIHHARTNGVSFQVVTADGWYGRNKAFRAT
jgi:SRSO17 transposase